MRLGLLACLVISCCCADATVVLDRIAVIVDQRVIKDSDIEREIRLTSFLNGEPPRFTPEARKKAANRLIEQALIRRESQAAQYTQPKPDEVEKVLAEVRKQRFGSAAAFGAELKRYGITEEQLRKHLTWQLSVLNFIEQRFRAGVLVTDEEIAKYFDENRAKFRPAANGKAPALEDVRESIVEQIAGERVNRDFFDWLERSRRRVDIRYREKELQ